MVGMEKLDLAAMVPARSYGIYPSPLTTFGAFETTSARIVSRQETIVAIAKDLGYRYSSGLSAAWRRITGYSPTEWQLRPAKARRASIADVRKKLPTAA